MVQLIFKIWGEKECNFTIFGELQDIQTLLKKKSWYLTESVGTSAHTCCRRSGCRCFPMAEIAGGRVCLTCLCGSLRSKSVSLCDAATLLFNQQCGTRTHGRDQAFSQVPDASWTSHCLFSSLSALLIVLGRVSGASLLTLAYAGRLGVSAGQKLATCNGIVLFSLLYIATCI